MKTKLLLLAIALAYLAIGYSSASAATASWQGTSGNWNDAANWNATPVPGLGDAAIFNATGVNADETVYLNGDRTLASATFNSTGAVTLLGGNSSTPANNTLTLTGGLTVSAGTGVVTFGEASAAVNVTLSNGQTFTNNSTLTFNGNIYLSNVNNSTRTLTLGGTGDITFNGVIANWSGTGGNSSNLTMANTGVTTIAGANTFTGTIKLDAVSNVGSTLRMTNAAALQSVSTIQNTTNISAILGLQYAAGATLTYTGAGPAVDLTKNSSAGVVTNIALDGYSQSFASINMGQKNIVTVVNYATSGTPVLTMGNITGIGVANGSQSGVLNPLGSASISVGTVQPIAGTGSYTQTLVLAGSSTGNEITGNLSDGGGGTATTLAITKAGQSTWSMKGTSNNVGATTIYGGTLVLDYSTNDTTKLADAAALNLYGGTLQLKGGTHTEVVGSTTINNGGNFVTRPTGSATLSLGAITFTGGSVDFAADNIATTTSAVTNGILSQRATVGGLNFAMKSGNNIVAYDYATSGNSNYTGGSMSANTNYAVAGSQTLAGTTGDATNTLKITTTGASQSLAVGTSTLTTGAILFAGADNYSITTSGAGKIIPGILHHYGAGELTLGALGGALTQFGTGKTILSAAATADNDLSIYGGSVQFSANDQIGTNATAKTITLNGGTLIARTNGNITLDKNGTFARKFTIGLGGGTIDIIDGGSLTITGVISSGASAGTSEVYYAPLTLGGVNTNGTIILSGANTMGGGVILAGGVIQANVADVAGSSGAFGKFSTAAAGAKNANLTFTGGTLQFTSLSAGSDYSARIRNSTSAIKVDTNGQNVTWAGIIDLTNNAGLTKSGNGTLTLSAINSYGGATTVNAGTLAIGNSKALGNASSNLTAAGGTLDLGSYNVTRSGVVSFTGGTVQNGTLTNNTADYVAQSGTVSAALAGSVGLTKSGSGAFTLSGNNTYAGVTSVNAGKLLMSGSLSGSTAVSVAASASLELKTALIINSGTVTVSGTLQTSGGRSSVGALTLNNGATFAATISGTAAGSHSELSSVGITLSGSVTLAINSSGYTPNYRIGDLANSDRFALTIGGYNQLSSGKFANVALGADNNYANTYTFIDSNSHAWAVFYGVDFNSFSNGSFEVGNDIALVAIPEPSVLGSVLSGLGMLLFFQRSRRRRP